MYYGAPGFYYKAAYKTEADVTYTIKRVENPDTSFLEVENAGIGVLYYFYVQSMNGEGGGPEPIILSNYSGKIG